MTMPEPIQRFKYSGPDAAGGRDSAPGRKSFPMAETDNVVSTVQIFQKGVHNNLHVHLVEDGYWIVLGGRARFHGEGDAIIAELGQYDGVLLPAGTKYWFEGISDEPLEILRVNYRVREGPRRIEQNGQIREEGAPAAAGARGE
jgi:mannose-6-phosphate isomerase-like protein (cupin superfamily)